MEAVRKGFLKKVSLKLRSKGQKYDNWAKEQEKEKSPSEEGHMHVKSLRAGRR